MDKWNKRLNKIKENWELKSDNSLAKLMGMSQQAIQQIRKGETKPSAITKIKILDRLGFTAAREILIEILPEDQKKKFLEGWNNKSKKINKINKEE